MPGENLVFVHVPKIVQSLVRRCFIDNDEGEYRVTRKMLERQEKLSHHPWFYKGLLEKLFQEGYDSENVRNMEFMLLKVQDSVADGILPYHAGIVFGDKDSEDSAKWECISIETLAEKGYFNVRQADFLSTMVAKDDWCFVGGSTMY